MTEKKKIIKQDNQITFEYISNFLNRDGISGYEHDIANAYKEATQKAGAQISRDGFGSVIAKAGTKGPKIMLAAHMDEVGFVVQQITKQGFLKISPVGGHWPHTILAMQVKVINTAGKVFFGVVGSTSVHVLQQKQMTKVVQMTDVYVDLGFSSNQDVKQVGIDVGDQVIRVSKAKLLADKDKYMAKAVDNRIGVAIIAKVMDNIQGQSSKNQVYAVATAQEEVGLRGAKTATQQIQPDVAIAIDTTVSHDTPGIIPGDTQLGKGVAITMKDATAIANPVLANMLFNLGQKHQIPVYKFVSQGGGNDSGVTQYSKGGIPAVSISIPTRYLHTSFEIGSIKDFRATVALITEFIKMFGDKEYKSTLYK